MFIMGDYEVGDTLYFFFDTYDSNGASVTITGLAVTDLELYRDGSTTQRSSDNGFTLLATTGIDFDSTTGLHGFSIDTSDNSDAGFYIAGSQYLLNVNAVTIDGQTVRFSYQFTLGRLLKPTTAGRKLDVTSTGEAGIDWANIGSPTTTVNLSGTTVKTATDVETDTADIQSRIPAALGANGNMKADVRDYNGAAGTFALGLPSVNTTYWNGTAISSEIPTMLISSGTGAGQLNVTSGVIDSNLVQMVGVAQSATDLKDFADDGYDPATNKLQGVVLVDTTTTNTDMVSAAPSAVDISTQVAADLLAAHGSGSWTTATGFSTFNVGTDTVTVGTNNDKTGYSISGTLQTLDALDTAQDTQHTTTQGLITTVDTVVDGIKAKTDNLPTDPADASDIAASLSTVNSTLTTIAGYIDTEVAAIKAKTDNLPASPAATGDIPTVSQIWTTVLTEAYKTAGAEGTAAQLMYEIVQNLTEFSISGVTKTVKKLDGTDAKTYTLDSSTTPTSITETT